MDSIVFKVKYEDTLRRFNVAVNDDQRFDLSMEALRSKICSLFNLPQEADFRLTYTDEDDDSVTLVEDEDLHDVVRQGLDPVRITVHLGQPSSHNVQSSKSPQAGSGASGSLTPSLSFTHDVQPNIAPNVVEVLKSVQEPLRHLLQKLGSSSQTPQQQTTPDVSEIVKAVQEPLTQALSKLSLEMSSKAASVSPTLADLFDDLSKLGQSYLNASQSQSGAANLSSHDNASDGPKSNSEGRPFEGIRINDTVRPHPSETSQPVHKSTQATEGVEAPSRPPLRPSVSTDKGKDVMGDSFGKMSNTGDMKNSCAGNSGVNVPRCFREPYPSMECPFSSIPVAGSQRHSYEQMIKRPSSNRSFNKADGFGPIFHKGVRCDGCSVLPITGPRFKSKVKYDFDLCSVCFSRIGNLDDYTRIDFPVPYRHSWSFRATDPVTTHPVMNVPMMARLHGAKCHRPKLDSRFIMDVNVVDGTTISPSTPFTKIWRMHNNGKVLWTSGLQLVWIGGDRFSPSDSVVIEVPISGVHAENELDIAVDFIAPELPGIYTSYWRMAEPSGRRFGQRVWVQIQVDASMDLTRESTPSLNLNLPPDGNDQATDVNAELAFFHEAGDNRAPVLGKNHKIEMEDLTFPINDDLLVPSNMLRPSSAAASPSAPSVTEADFPTSVVGPFGPYPVNDDTSSAKSTASSPVFNKLGESSGSASTDKHAETNCNANEQASEKSVVEETLLKELEEMGFRQIDLNKEVLRQNEYDLDRSVDELCGVSEWDPILDELKEMGFDDKETNKKLLEKNGGSITRVVMDLIAEEKA